MDEEDGQDLGEVRMVGVCKVCQRVGKVNYLKVYQINFDEAITFCEDDTCTYPLGLDDPSDSIQKRNFTEIKNSPQRPQTPSIKKTPNAQQKITPNPPKQSAGLKFPNKEKPLAPYVVGKISGNGKSAVVKKETTEVTTRISQCVPSSSVQNAIVTVSIPPNLQTDSIKKIDRDLSTAENAQFNSFLNINGSVSTLHNAPSDSTTSMQNTNGGLKDTSHCKIPDSNQNSVADVSDVCKNSKRDSDKSLFGVFNEGSTHSMLYPQWQNKDALCWLDVIMSLLVHSRHLQTIATQSVHMSQENQSVLISLVKAYSQACTLINFSKKEAVYTRKSESLPHNRNICQAKTFSSTEIDTEERKVVRDLQNLTVKDKNVKTGAGLSFSSDFNDNMSFYMTEEYQKGFTILNDCRESLFQYLQPKLKCTKGQNDSPVFAIPLLVKGNSRMEELMKMKYSFQFVCDQCGFRKEDKYEIALPTFPNTVSDFQMSSPAFQRPCFKCSAPNQRRVMVYERLSDVVLVHFVQGLPFSDLSALDFTFDGRRYSVTGLVQYRNDPDHFVTWIRDPSGTMWLEYDDLKSPVCQFKSMSLNVPASQFHIVMWEGSGKTSSVERHGQTVSENLSPVASSKGNSGLEIKFPEVDRITSENDVCYEESMEVDPGINENLQSDVGSGNQIEKTKKKDALKTVKVKQKPKVVEQNNDPDVKKPVPSQGLMMVAFTPDGKLVPTSMLNFVSAANPNGQTRSFGDADSFSQTFISNSLSDSLELKAANFRGRQLRRYSGGTSNDPPRFSCSQISLLRSLKTRKNSLVKDVEADRVHTEVVERKQTLARQNSGTKTSNPTTKTKKLSQFVPTTCPKKSVSHQDFSFRGKKFASYKMEREVQRQSSCSPVSELSDYSAPCSPAVSCHSDGVLFQKRKSDSCISYDKSETYKGKKQRKSEDFSETEKFMTELLKADDRRSMQNEIHKSNEECDVLKSLYSALNMQLPEEESSNMEKSSVKTGKDSDDLPDVKNLASFINDDTANSLDEFLAQL